jgi:hypothetical protein
MPNQFRHSPDGKKESMLDALLDYLCPDDPEEAGRRYVRLHKKLEGYFRLKGMSDPSGDADETLKRAGEKIEKGQNIPDITNFCKGIARNLVHERLREKKKEDNAFLKFVNDNKDKSSDAARLDETTKFMKRCFEKLPEDDQNLLISYCKAPPGMDRAEHRRQLAERGKLSIAALRIRITRLRRDLEDCVKALRKKS